jgi:TrmH family RNA methyltransferase
MERSSPHTPVSSKENKAVKFLTSLYDPKIRKKEWAFLIEGVKMVEEALREGTGVRQVIAAPSLTRHHGKGIITFAEKNGIDVLWISERLMDWISEAKTPQPALAVVEMRGHTQEQLLADDAKLIVLCHQLQDPGNLGTIIRTAEAAGASGVAVTANTVDPYNAKCVRASMGSILRVRVVNVADPGAFIGACKQKGFRTAAMTLAGGKAHFQVDLSPPTVVMVGQEGAGLPKGIADAADLQVRIPMKGATDSLNAAVSTAVVLYEAMRQRTAGSAS